VAVNVVQSALSSRRFNRWLLVLGAVVLAAGIVAILVTQIGGNAGSSSKENANPTGPPISIPKAQKNIRFPASGWKVAREFVMNVTQRRNLARTYALADANVRGGLTLAQWKTGNIPVPYFPTAKIIRYNFKNTNFAHPRAAAVNLILVPKKNSGMRLTPFQIEVVKVGHGASAHWVVDYFGSMQGVPVPHE
jgi:hypothetical protein